MDYPTYVDVNRPNVVGDAQARHVRGVAAPCIVGPLLLLLALYSASTISWTCI